MRESSRRAQLAGRLPLVLRRGVVLTLPAAAGRLVTLAGGPPPR